MVDKFQGPSARPLSEGPVFQKVTRTPPFHMLAHDGPVPKAGSLQGCEYHRLLVPGTYGNQHNPTVWVDSDGTLKVVVRVLNGAQTTNFVGRVGEDWTLEDTHQIKSRDPTGSLEDFRVFVWEGNPWALAAHHNGSVPPKAIRQALVELSSDCTEILRVHEQPSTRHEKNWMPLVVGEKLKFVYSTDPLIVLDTLNRRASPSAAMLPQVTGVLRGGSQLVPFEDGYLALVHQVHKPATVEKQHNALISSFWPPIVTDPVSGIAPVVYLHRFAKFSSDLSKVALSQPFQFRGFGIEFVAGLTWWEDRFVAALGVADREAWLVEISSETVSRMF